MEFFHKFQEHQLLRRLLPIILVPIIAVGITWLTGQFAFVSGQSTFRTGSVQTAQYGFPLIWKTHTVSHLCSIRTPWCGPAVTFDYVVQQWPVFALDMLLYTGIGFLVLHYLDRKYFLHRFLVWGIIIPVLAAWMTIGAGFLQSGIPPTNPIDLPYGTLSAWNPLSANTIVSYTWMTFIPESIIFVIAGYIVFFFKKGARLIRWC